MPSPVSTRRVVIAPADSCRRARWYGRGAPAPYDMARLITTTPGSFSDGLSWGRYIQFLVDDFSQRLAGLILPSAGVILWATRKRALAQTTVNTMMPCFRFSANQPAKGLIPAFSALGIALAAVLCMAGCGSTQSSALDYERHEGTLRGSAFDIRIRWEGDRCVAREIRITRDCGMCRSRNVTNAVVEDFDCDGNTDHMQFRHLDEEQRVDKLALDEDAWLAFYHIVPAAERGLYRR